MSSTPSAGQHLADERTTQQYTYFTGRVCRADGSIYTDPSIAITPQQIAADAYSAAGLHVVALHPGTKKPIAEGWQEQADEYTAPWLDPTHPHYNPRNNLGCRLDGGLIVLDVDTKYPEASEWIERMKALHGEEWLDTPTHQTVSGGQHLWYLVNGGNFPRTIINLDGCHIDILAGKRQAVLPGSVVELPDGTRRMYKHLRGENIARGGCPSPIPAWLVEKYQAWQEAKAAPAAPSITRPRIITPTNPSAEAKRKQAQAEATMLGAIDDLVRCAPGTRNDTLHAKSVYLAAQARDAGWDDNQIWRALEAGWARLGKPTGEGRATIKSGLSYGSANPRSLPPARPLANRLAGRRLRADYTPPKLPAPSGIEEMQRG